MNSLDPENLKKNFKNEEDITYDEIACFKAASLLDAFAGGRADYVMVDVEGGNVANARENVEKIAGAIAGIAIGAVVGLLCIGAIIFFAMKSGKNVDPK